MNAGGVDKACKSSAVRKHGAANELVTPWYVPQRRAQLAERRGNSRYSRKGKDDPSTLHITLYLAERIFCEIRDARNDVCLVAHE